MCHTRAATGKENFHKCFISISRAKCRNFIFRKFSFRRLTEPYSREYRGEMETTTTIKVWKDNDCWIAEIPGLCTAPTPFTARASFDAVKARLEQCNPGAEVIEIRK